jgi:hypothetical protein
LPTSCRAPAHFHRRGRTPSGKIARAIASGIADLGLAAEHALPGHRAHASARIACGGAAEDELASRRQVDSRGGGPRFRRPHHLERAAHVTSQAAKLGARLRFRARMNNFDAIGQMVAGNTASPMPELPRAAAHLDENRGGRIKSSWADRRLVCARSFKASQPAQQLAEHLRKSAR